MQNNMENRIVLQRKLRFEEEEIWSELPESTRDHCRGLWRQLLESVLNSGDPVDSGSSEQSAQPCEGRREWWTERSCGAPTLQS